MTTKPVTAKSFLKNQKGANLVEYLIILLLVAVSAIAIFMRFGTTVRNTLNAADTDVTTNVVNQDPAGR
jgi:Flp pilus assembly pilin Flp